MAGAAVVAAAEVAVCPKLKEGATDAAGGPAAELAPNLNGESVVVVSATGFAAGFGAAAVEPKVKDGTEEVAEAVAFRPKLKEAETSAETLLDSPKDGAEVVEAVDKVFSSFESVPEEAPKE